MQTACCHPRITWWAIFTRCVLTRVWKLNDHPIFIAEPREASLIRTLSFLPYSSISVSCWHYFLRMVSLCPLLSISAARDNAIRVLATIFCLPVGVAPPQVPSRISLFPSAAHSPFCSQSFENSCLIVLCLGLKVHNGCHCS